MPVGVCAGLCISTLWQLYVYNLCHSCGVIACCIYIYILKKKNPGALLSYALLAVQYASLTFNGRPSRRQRTYSFRGTSQHSKGSHSDLCRK